MDREIRERICELFPSPKALGRGAASHPRPHKWNCREGAAARGWPRSAATSAAILGVEDDPAVRGVACGILRNADYRALSAGSPEAALSACENHAGELDRLLTDVVNQRPAALSPTLQRARLFRA